MTILVRLILSLGLYAMQQPPDDSTIVHRLRPEAAVLLATKLTERFAQAQQSDENCYAILGSHQSQSGRPEIILHRDDEWIVQPIAWDTARGSDDPDAPLPAVPTPLDFLFCYPLKGTLKGRIEKCEPHAALSDLRVVSSRHVDYGVELELELEVRVEQESDEELGLRVDFADEHSLPNVVHLEKLPAQGESSKVCISVTLNREHLPPRSSSVLMVDIIRIRRAKSPAEETTVASISNTAVTFVNVLRLVARLSQP